MARGDRVEASQAAAALSAASLFSRFRRYFLGPDVFGPLLGPRAGLIQSPRPNLALKPPPSKVHSSSL
jgi:hypothetical protein